MVQHDACSVSWLDVETSKHESHDSVWKFSRNMLSPLSFFRSEFSQFPLIFFPFPFFFIFALILFFLTCPFKILENHLSSFYFVLHPHTTLRFLRSKRCYPFLKIFLHDIFVVYHDNRFWYVFILRNDIFGDLSTKLNFIYKHILRAFSNNDMD